MLLAKRSGKGAVENQKYVLLAAQRGQSKGFAFEIRQLEIRGGLLDGNACQIGSFS